MEVGQPAHNLIFSETVQIAPWDDITGGAVQAAQ
jgi:hypothetical protein